MNRHILETLMGAVVLVVAVTFMIFAYASADLQRVDGYPVMARFDRIDGLDRGADVRISGVKVGTVVGQELDEETYLAEITMSIRSSVELPTDTAAVIASESLLGGKYVSLQPGGAAEMLEPGGLIEFTQSPLDFERLVGQLIYGLQGDGGDGGGDGGGAGATPGLGGGPGGGAGGGL